MLRLNSRSIKLGKVDSRRPLLVERVAIKQLVNSYNSNNTNSNNINKNETFFNTILPNNHQYQGLSNNLIILHV